MRLTTTEKANPVAVSISLDSNAAAVVFTATNWGILKKFPLIYNFNNHNHKCQTLLRFHINQQQTNF